MKWLQLTATFLEAPEDWSPYIDIFVRHGCENTVQTDRPPTLAGCIVTVNGHEEIIENTVTVGDLPEIDWDAVWRQYFKARRVGERFVIVPSWDEYEPVPGDLTISLDPGQAFGTGDHPTTRLCLALMETVDMEGKEVADIGCGSGILSIGAVQLGAKRVVAVDIDQVSVEVALENAARNNVEFQAVVGDGLHALAHLAEVDEPGAEPLYDVVLSNIISAVLIRLAPDVAVDLRPGGTWLVSGVIPDNWPDVQESAEKLGFSMIEKREEDGWVAATFRR
jgi:ribosomal protein L11 methyltransferase